MCHVISSPHYALFFYFAVPDPVSNFRAELKAFSVLFEWGPPVELNEMFVTYELTYRPNDNSPMQRNFTDITTTNFTMEFVPSTNVTGISMRAYTKVGPGIASVAADIAVPAEPVPREFAS